MAIKTKSTAAPSVSASGEGGGSYEDVSTDIRQRCAIVSIWGPTGSGRTRLALTAPGPIAFNHAGEKIQGTLQKAILGINEQVGPRKIKVFNFGVSVGGTEQEIANACSPVWTQLETNVKSAQTGNFFRSTVLDTDTEAWELERLAFFGELNPQGRTDSLYGPVNARWRALFKTQRAAYARNELAGIVNRPNLIVIGQAKDEYKMVKKEGGKKTSEKTGELIQAGQKEVAFMADVVLKTGRDPATGGFTCEVTKGWYNAIEAEGTIFTDDDIRFSFIMATITGTSEEEWL